MAEENNLREENPQVYQDEVLSTGVLSLDVPDESLVRILDSKIKQSEDWFVKEQNLTKRRQINLDYWKGKQVDQKMLYDWQVPYVDNVIYRNVETIIPIAVSRVPNVIVTPNGEEPDKRKRAKNLQRVLDTRLKSRFMRDALRTMSRHVLINYIGIIKCRWDKYKQTYIFDALDPTKVTLDHTATPNSFGLSSENFDFIAEWIEEPLKVVISKFPSKKEAIFERTPNGYNGESIKQGNESQLANKIRYREIWFTWYDKEGNPQEGVCWKYKDLILNKIKNPYWDYEGKTIGVGIDQNDKLMTDKIFYNYFKTPNKPYILVNYQNMGQGPMDTTSPIEQAIPLQDVVNKRGRQITELADKANPKKVFSDDFITKEDAARVSDDPNEHIWGNGDVNAGMKYIPGIPPNPSLYQDLIQNRSEIDNIIGAHSTTRGEVTGGRQSGVSKQITREGDLGRIDDFVMNVIEPAADEMSQWAVQMMKVFATKENFVEVLGMGGESEFVEFDRDSIDDGINVMVKASSVDKTERKATAAQLASAGLEDPLSLYEDLDALNPVERAKRFIFFRADPTGQLYLQYILSDTQAASDIGAFVGANIPGQPITANMGGASQTPPAPETPPVPPMPETPNTPPILNRPNPKSGT